MKSSRYLLPVMFAALLTGCASKGADDSERVRIESWLPPTLPEAEPRQVMDGSLFDAAYSTNLFVDQMAYRVGDILTINLDERTRSSYNSGTSFDKQSGTSMPIPIFWGRSGEETSLGMNRNFSGSGSSSQDNMLDGSITVSVINVLPNGALYVRGEKLIRLNQGDEFIRISGILRPEDISPDNTISSQRLANARIAYSGEGTLGNANEAGWLTEFFNDPLFPM